jgi:hypothetical protein
MIRGNSHSMGNKNNVIYSSITSPMEISLNNQYNEHIPVYRRVAQSRQKAKR